MGGFDRLLQATGPAIVTSPQRGRIERMFLVSDECMMRMAFEEVKVVHI